MYLCMYIRIYVVVQNQKVSPHKKTTCAENVGTFSHLARSKVCSLFSDYINFEACPSRAHK